MATLPSPSQSANSTTKTTSPTVNWSVMDAEFRFICAPTAACLPRLKWVRQKPVIFFQFIGHHERHGVVKQSSQSSKVCFSEVIRRKNNKD